VRPDLFSEDGMGWDDGILFYVHERGVLVFGFFVPFLRRCLGWVIWTNLGDFNCYPVGLLRKWAMVWHGIVWAWVSNCTFARVAP
jgi:hypothetical protein